MKLKDYFFPPLPQDDPEDCGIYSTAFAIEAKASMKKLSEFEVDISGMQKEWSKVHGFKQGFLLPLANSLNFFKNIPIETIAGKKLQITNIQTLHTDWDSICRTVDNLAVPIIAIKFFSRSNKGGYLYYGKKNVGVPAKRHIVCVIDYTDDYLILNDSANGQYSRILKEDIDIVDDVCTFNVKLYVPEFIYPLEKHYRVSQKFGENPEWYRHYGILAHEGIDVACPKDTKVLAVIDGEITVKDDGKKGYGLNIRLKNDSYEVIFAHLSSVNVKSGQIVHQGDFIGLSGNSGNSSGFHIHLGIRGLKNGKVINYDNGYFGYFNPEEKITF